MPTRCSSKCRNECQPSKTQFRSSIDEVSAEIKHTSSKSLVPRSEIMLPRSELPRLTRRGQPIGGQSELCMLKEHTKK
ncbi:hypothetical protein SOVF_170990 [Spinacia oleracea]|nr:hypothetical protein SOVF_170990 [Spinacia oleracea]